jgi:hypothetical protein
MFALHVWDKCGQEYYKIYPAITAAMSKLTLDLNLEDYATWGQDQFASRFAVGFEPLVIGENGVEHRLKLVVSSMNVSNDTTHRPLLITFSIWTSGHDDTRLVSGVRVYCEGPLVFDTESEIGPNIIPSAISSKMMKAELRAAIFPRLIKNDPTIVAPEVLSRDEQNWNIATQEQREAMVARAKRKGKFGFSIGKEYETMPHFRRPHFALRHTGKGGAIPKIVPVKSSIVHREVLTRVPTGHYDANGNEVEPKA